MTTPEINPKEKQENPLKLIFGIGQTIFWILLLLFLVFEGLSLFAQNTEYFSKEYSKIFSGLGNDIKNLGTEVYVFLKPFLQLSIILLLLDWILKKLGISFTSPNFKLEWNVQSLIAIVIITAFTIGALAGVNYADSLKDLALVVVGFYFGTQRTFDVITKEGKTTVSTVERGSPIVPPEIKE